MDTTLLLAIALGIGLVIGLEREYTTRETSKLFAGVRTFPLISLLGFLATYWADKYSVWILVVAFAALALLVAISYYILAKDGYLGGTTEITVFVAFFAGAMVYRQEVLLALEIAIGTALMLSLKLRFSDIFGKINQRDTIALVNFLIMTAIVLPVLPDRALGPYNAINPRDVWYMVIIISSVSFFGYLISKFAGSNQGIILTSILGGIASSTVLTFDFSQKSRQSPEISRNYGVGIVLASSIMYIRLWILILLFHQPLAMNLLLPFGLLSAGGLLVVFIVMRQQHLHESTSNVDIPNPLNIKGALKFAAVFSGILLLVRVAEDYLGNQGIYLVSAFSGTVEMDAITISMTKFARDAQSMAIAGNAIVLASITNTLFKYGITLTMAERGVKKITSFGYGVITLTGLLYLMVYNLVR